MSNPTEYKITFKIDGRRQIWYRFGSDIYTVLARAKEVIAKEWPGKIVRELCIREG